MLRNAGKPLSRSRRLYNVCRCMPSHSQAMVLLLMQSINTHNVANQHIVRVNEGTGDLTDECVHGIGRAVATDNKRRYALALTGTTAPWPCELDFLRAYAWPRVWPSDSAANRTADNAMSRLTASDAVRPSTIWTASPPSQQKSAAHHGRTQTWMQTKKHHR